MNYWRAALPSSTDFTIGVLASGLGIEIKLKHRFAALLMQPIGKITEKSADGPLQQQNAIGCGGEFFQIAFDWSGFH